MDNCLKIIRILKENNILKIDYEANGEWTKCLNINNHFFAEYAINIEAVPDSVCIIPFLCNIIPIAWVFDLTICVKDIDYDFYNCIEDIKLGYTNMYPNINMQGKLIIENLVKNTYVKEKNAVFFSGGVDAFSTLISHIDEKPDLITIWGADITLEDINGWENVKKHNELVADEHNLEFLYIKTNFRSFINYKYLSQYVSKRINGEWWHEFQHGIGLIGLAFPYSYIRKYKILYIASSYTASQKGTYTCASDPTIDNYLKGTGCKVIHDGYEYTRQEKVHNICQFFKETKRPINLRVCWESSGGNNCNECEKCWRTIVAIIAERENPENYGLHLPIKRRAELTKKLYKYTKYNHWFYNDIQKTFLKNYTLEETPKDLLWLRDINIVREKPKYMILFDKIKIKIKNIIKRIIKIVANSK